MRAKRSLVLLICGVFVAALLVSGVFISTHAAHDCAGEDCAVCAVLSSCEQLLRTLGAFLVALGFAMLCAAILRARMPVARWNLHPATLVSLKVKLTN